RRHRAGFSPQLLGREPLCSPQLWNWTAGGAFGWNGTWLAWTCPWLLCKSLRVGRGGQGGEVRFGKGKEDTFLKDHSSRILYPRHKSLLPKMMNADMDAVDAENQVELEEKTRLINQVLELQHTLEDLSARVDAVKEENLKLKSENQVLGQYIENLMSASSVFQTTDTKSKRK
uniref:Short coiled-coil protein n=1 Tax=Macaca fascicularis TaxID=9541 RepID=A0A7N9CVI5_MACFA